MEKVDIGALKKNVKIFGSDLDIFRKELSKTVVGQGKVVNGLLHGLLANAHVLVEGVPGTAKTLIVKSLAAATGCKYGRIQFTVDLLPAEITGVTAYDEKRGGLYIIKGPIFANFVLADEINRAPPKTQSALLEAMQEHQVTIGKQTFKLEEPFFVMATQNPIEESGTYPLPEAQTDRFLLKLLIDYPEPEEEERILNKNITLNSFHDYDLQPVLSPSKIIEMQKLTKMIYIKPEIEKYIVSIVEATRKPSKYDINLGKYVQLGGSPRASIGLFIASKAEALLQSSYFVTPDHIKKVAHHVLRHRIRVSYEGQSEGITSDKIIDEILSKVKVP
ncbi:MAG: MoxR family ATPase [Nanoarchaeota archaeon]